MIDRRRFLLTGGSGLAACAAARKRGPAPVAVGDRQADLDRVLAANAIVLPEGGGGANHYPMAAEAWTALDAGLAIPTDWLDGAQRYAASRPRPPAGAATTRPALGDYERYGGWLGHFRAELAASSWREVIRRWVPRLAPGLAGALCHGLIRTAHAVRALRASDTVARRSELAAGLAYWAARFLELPAGPTISAPSVDGLARALAGLDHADLAADADVDFGAATGHLLAWSREHGRDAAAPASAPERPTGSPGADLRTLVQAAAVGFLAMLVQERQRIWLLHGVTAPACAELLLPELDAAGARRLAQHTRRAVVALWGAFGAAFTPGQGLGVDLPTWPQLVREALSRQSVHGTKVVEALRRCSGGRSTDELHRATVVTWLQWV